MENEKRGDKPGLASTRAQFDDVLIAQLRRLLEIETLEATLSFNLSSIACLLLLVERENERKNSPQNPPERYTRETFLDDLADMGLEIDGDLMDSFKALAQHGYVAIDAENHYNAQISAFAIVNFLDNLFPGMTGMNLVGYILQMIDEVISGRKEMAVALKQFEQTLQTQGISLSQQQLKKDERESVKKHAVEKSKIKESVKISEDLKKAYTSKLSKLRTQLEQESTKAKVFQSATSSGSAQVRDVFGTPSVDEDKAELPEIDAQDAGTGLADAVEAQTVSPDMEEETRQAALQEKEDEIKAAEMAAREAEIRAREAEIRMREAEMKAREAAAAKETADEVDSEAVSAGPAMDIEGKIAAFQETLAMTCPVCQAGSVSAALSEKGKEYYSCSNENCGFISWGKPYAFECPVCRNNFLIEVSNGAGGAGLKCPRSTCSYRQDHLGPPASASNGGQKKKRRKLVRRVRRK